MSIISYEVFLANVTQGDLQALNTLLSGQQIATPDPVEAEAYQAAGMRLFDAEVVTRLTRSVERQDGVVWHVFEARVNPVAVGYMAQAAWLGVEASREEPA